MYDTTESRVCYLACIHYLFLGITYYILSTCIRTSLNYPASTRTICIQTMATSYNRISSAYFIFCSFSLLLLLLHLAAGIDEFEVVDCNDPNINFPLLLTPPTSSHDSSSIPAKGNLNGQNQEPENGIAMISYSTVNGYFLQDLASTDASSFDYVSISILLCYFSVRYKSIYTTC